VTAPAEQLSTARASAPRLPLSAVAAIALLGTWIVLALAAAWIAPYDPDQVDLFNLLQAPSAAHWFGTDQVGRDVLSRIIYGARIDLMMCVLGVVPALVIGTTIGLVSGYYGGLTDALFMRIYDITVAFPFFVLVLAIVGVLGPGLTNYFIALALVAWVTYARIVRAEVLVVRQSEYVLAARVLGYPTRAIIFRHVLPNALSPVAAYSMTDAILVILAGASLGFLGMGAQPPTAEWGVMIADGQPFVQQAWWICLFPGLALISLGLGLAFLGDALGAFRRRLD
jgi:peptide/nickel transport system permease protein